jgi:IclR family acetate operon transcriptional repressor
MTKIPTATPTGKDEPGNASVQVISRAVAILRALKENPAGLSLSEIAKRVDLPRSTVQRIVRALDQESLVIASSSNGGFALGPLLLALAASTRFEIVDFLRPTLEVLARETGESVDLSVINQDRAVFVDQVTGTQRLTAVSAVGVAFPLHCSANGKAMLAALSDKDIVRLQKNFELTRRTVRTITAWPELLSEIDNIRETGIAVDREENSIGICAIAASFRGPKGELAAISIPVPVQRFASRELELAALLKSHATRLQLRHAR